MDRLCISLSFAQIWLKEVKAHNRMDYRWHSCLISLVPVGTLSGMALHNSIQNHDFITAWHKDSHDLWTRQAQIDQRLQTRINELQAVVINIGDQI